MEDAISLRSLYGGNALGEGADEESDEALGAALALSNTQIKAPQTSPEASSSSSSGGKVVDESKSSRAVVKPSEADAAESEEGEEDDEELLENVFKALAGTKSRCSIKDLLNWDFVLDLLGEVSLLRCLCLNVYLRVCICVKTAL